MNLFRPNGENQHPVGYTRWRTESILSRRAFNCRYIRTSVISQEPQTPMPTRAQVRPFITMNKEVLSFGCVLLVFFPALP